MFISDLTRNRLAIVDLAAGDDDVGAALRKCLDHLMAKAATAAGDKNDLAGEIKQRVEGHAASSFA